MDSSFDSAIRLDSVNHDLSLKQLRGGLTFGTDAYLLAAYTRPRHKENAVELGCGTGIVSLLCGFHKKFKSITAIEVQPSFAVLSQQNIEDNELGDRVRVLQKDLRDLKSTDLGGEVGAVFANPPYMRTDSGKRNTTDEKWIARHEVCGGISDFCNCAGRILKTGGLFTVVFRPDRLPELMSALHGARLEPKRMTFVHADRNAVPCVVLVEAAKDAAASLIVTPPLFLYREGNESPRTLTDKAAAVYDTCVFGY